MKKTNSLLSIAALALLGSSQLACSGSEDPDPISGDGDGDGDGDVMGDGDVVGDGDGDVVGDGDGDGGPTTSTFVTGGLGENGAWKGYLWTASEPAASIMPAEFTGSDLCVSGTLPGGYENWAMVGWNINQEIDPETFMGGAVNTIDTAGTTGVAVTVSNPGASGLRVQIQTSDGADAISWCADVPATGSGTIPWADFKRECWPGGMNTDAYDGSPLAQVAVQTYAASDTSPTSFEYCVISLGPG